MLFHHVPRSSSSLTIQGYSDSTTLSVSSLSSDAASFSVPAHIFVRPHFIGMRSSYFNTVVSRQNPRRVRGDLVSFSAEPPTRTLLCTHETNEKEMFEAVAAQKKTEATNERIFAGRNYLKEHTHIYRELGNLCHLFSPCCPFGSYRGSLSELQLGL